MDAQPPSPDPVFTGTTLEARAAGHGIARAILTMEVISDHECDALLKELTRAIDEAGPSVAVDCGRLRHVSSAMLGTLIQARTRADEAGGKMVLFALPDTIREVLTLTRLDTVFAIAETFTDALAALSGEAE